MRRLAKKILSVILAASMAAGIFVSAVYATDVKRASADILMDQQDVSENPESEVEYNEESIQLGTMGDEVKYSVEYSSHVQNIGWQDYVKDGEKSGTEGKAYRLESMKIKVFDLSGGGHTQLNDAISYSVHVQNLGWIDPVSDGAPAGTEGRALRLEAIKINLGSALSSEYDVFYRVHAQNYGTLGWAKNGEPAGTEGQALRLEQIEIQICKKGTGPLQIETAFCTTTDKGNVTYQAHVQNKGWMSTVADGTYAGTKGQSLRVEGIRIWLDKEYDSSGELVTGILDENGELTTGGIEYCAHVQNKGWLPYVSEGELAGTEGEALRVEAVKIRLTGDLAKKYHIYYRVHIQNFGDMDWARDDEPAGSAGYAARVESIEIMVVKDGASTTPADDPEVRSYISDEFIGDIACEAYVHGDNWLTSVGSGEICGTVGEGKALESLKLTVDTALSGNYQGGISYSVHVSNDGWLKSVSDGTEAGTPGSGKMIQAVQISLTDELAKYCDIYYQAQIQDYGWLGWARNGQYAGSTGCSYRLEALKVVIVPKGTAAPGRITGYYKTHKKGGKMIALTFDDGPSQYTIQILNQLEKYGAHATFFVLGPQVSSYASTIKKMSDIGCEIGNHSWSHSQLTTLSSAAIKNELNNTSNAVKAITGSGTSIMRPPYGSVNGNVSASVGMPMIIWNIDTLDWSTRNTQSTINSVLGSVSNGDIILMHDLYSATAAAAIQLIPTLINMGYELVTVSELAEAQGYDMQNGVSYYSFK